MKLPHTLISPFRIVASMVIGIFVYLLWIGPEKFYYESFGTWIMSPLIYVRILPVPLNHVLLHALHDSPWLTYLLYAAPVLLMLIAFGVALTSIRKQSVASAFGALALMTLVLGVYHFLQPMGITLIRPQDPLPRSAAVN